MKVLLIAMPDTTSCFDHIMEVPNLGICSIAGNLEGCEVKVLDLILHKKKITAFIEKVMNDFDPDIVGLSAMSFQYESAKRIAGICKRIKRDVFTVLGGYHASLMYQEIGNSEDRAFFDFITRGEGEVTFNRLIQELSSNKRNFPIIQGLSFKQNGTFHHNLPSPLLDLERVKLPNRDCRVLTDFEFMKKRFDCAETSRGCTLPCNFCSITKMYGRSFRLYSIERIIQDLKNLQAKGVKGVFFVDDNITLHVKRLKELCKAMVQEKVNDLYYIIQASVPGIASDPELAGWLRQAGFRLVFMGIESGIERNLKEMSKKGVFQNTRKAVSLLQKQDICVLGGFIIGNPKDDREDVKSTYDYAYEIGVDHAIVQCMTPYPKTEVREKLLTQGFIANPDDLTRYTGFICNVRTEFLTTEELRKWMILYGIKLYFNPRYILRNRLWIHHKGNAHHMFMNNIKFVVDGLRGRLFYSRHSW
jgi:radical SAM superfamily enzyme YgiQ (UPF0313 family)